MTDKIKSGIIAFLYTKTSITIEFQNKSKYRYDLSKVLTKQNLNEMIELAESGSGLTRYINNHPDIKKYGYLDSMLDSKSFRKYG